MLVTPILRNSGYKDLHKKFFGTQKKPLLTELFTYSTTHPIMRIDYIWGSPSFPYKVLSCGRVQCSASDHFPLLLELAPWIGHQNDQWNSKRMKLKTIGSWSEVGATKQFVVGKCQEMSYLVCPTLGVICISLERWRTDPKEDGKEGTMIHLQTIGLESFQECWIVHE